MTTIEDSIANVVTSLNTLLYANEDVLDAIRDRIEQHAHDALNEAADAVQPIIEAVLKSVDVVLPHEQHGHPDWAELDRLLRDTSDALGHHELVAASMSDRAVDSVNMSITSAISDASDLIGAVIKALSDMVSGLFGSLTEAPELWAELTSQIGRVLTDNEPSVTDWLTRTWSAIQKGALDNPFLPHDGIIVLDDDGGVGDAGDGQTVEDLINQWKSYPPVLQGIFNGLLMCLNAFTLVGAQEAGYASKLTQRSMYLNTPIPLSPSELVNLVRRGDVGAEWAKEHAKRSGVSPQIFDLLYTLTHNRLTPRDYIEMWRRTGDDAQLDSLRLIGIDDDDIARLRTMAFALPTPSDLVRFMVRDVYDPGVVQRDRLDEEFTTKVQNAPWQQVGIELETLKQYWMAHWQLPSPSMLYEMVHRGIIDQPRLIEALKQADWAPGWIDNLVAINYNVPGRIDVRRMYESGVITTHAELVKRHQDMGYSPADAETLAQFVEALKAKQDEADAERLHAPIAQEIIRSYGAGGLPYDEAHADLVGLGYTDEVATYRLQLGIFEREKDRSQRVRTAIGRQYVHGEIDEGTARDRLASYNVEANEQDSLLSSWNLDRELREWTDEERHQRDLSKAEILEAFTDRIMDRPATLSALISAGYDAREAETIVSLAEARIAKADAKVVEAAVKTEYVTRRIEATEASNTLAGFGFTQERIAPLLARWSVEREERRPDISAGQIERMLMQGVIDPDRMEALLLERGYTPEHVALLMTLYGTDMSVAADKLEEQKREFAIRESRLTSQGTRRLDLTERGQNLAQNRFQAQQAGLQQRFDAQQRQQVELQTARLQANAASENRRIAAQTARDAAHFAANRESQQRQIEAAASRLDTQIKAANARQQQAIQEQNVLADRRAQLATQSQQAQSTLQAQRLRAEADRTDKSIQAAASRAAAAANNQRQLEQIRASHQTDLTKLRADIQRARDIQMNAQKIADEQRQEQVRIRQETRASARKDIATGRAQAQAAQLQALQLNQTAAVAQLQAQFAALQAQLAAERQQQALTLQQAAEAALRAATPVASLLDTNT